MTLKTTSIHCAGAGEASPVGSAGQSSSTREVVNMAAGYRLGLNTGLQSLSMLAANIILAELTTSRFQLCVISKVYVIHL